MSWYSRARRIRSLGSSAPRPGSLAGLAAARRQHGAQFFTPDAIAGALWQLVAPAASRAIDAGGGQVSVLDTSVGSGRLIQFANADQHQLAGLDVHPESIDALIADAEAAGFETDLVCASMADACPEGFGIGLINPPFSIHLESPHLAPLAGTGWGRFGANTAATSHVYALFQALAACDVVGALVPVKTLELVKADTEASDRLRAVIPLPRSAFASEGVRSVAVCLLIFDSAPCETMDLAIDRLPVDLGLTCRTTLQVNPQLNVRGLDDTPPAITLPVTGNPQVRVVHDGRRIGLHFACGLIEAKVRNAILRAPITPMKGHRHPRTLKYIGQGQLDLEYHLLQDDPQQSFNQLLEVIRQAGGQPQVDPGLADLLAQHIEVRFGYSPVVMHGKRSIKDRTQELDDRFRFGNCPTLVATLGVTQEGLNLPQASRVLFLCRDWVHKTEQQAAARVLRPQQTRDVQIDFVHLPGSPDVYQAQMVAFKAEAASVGIDYAEPELDEVPFFHLDHLVEQMVSNLTETLNCKRHELRERLLQAA